MIPRLLGNIAHKKDSINRGATDLLVTFENIFGADTLVPYFVRVLETTDKLKIKTSAIEVLNILFK
jgi:hypothetical protein